jgi:hypothetical protein
MGWPLILLDAIKCSVNQNITRGFFTAGRSSSSSGGGGAVDVILCPETSASSRLDTQFDEFPRELRCIWEWSLLSRLSITFLLTRKSRRWL